MFKYKEIHVVCWFFFYDGLEIIYKIFDFLIVYLYNREVKKDFKVKGFVK